MKNKQTFFVVVFLGVVTSLIVFAMNSRFSFLKNSQILPSFSRMRGQDAVSMQDMEPYMQGMDQSTRDTDAYMQYPSPDFPVSDEFPVEPMPEPMLIDKMNDSITTGSMPIPYFADDYLYLNDRVYQKSSYHSVVVNDVPSYLRGMKEYFLSIDGKVLNSSISSNGDYNSGDLYVKVPVAKFEEATSRVTENVDKVVNENIDASDITGRLVGTTETVQALLDQKSLKEAALLDAKTEVEKRRFQIEIDRLTKQITAAEKSLDQVEQQVEYSSISITAADSERYFNPSARPTIKEEILRAWTSLKELLRVVGYFGIWVLVYSITWIPLVWVASKTVSKLKNNQINKNV
ncbi:MAG: DUF4349 domain-containing protein [Pseudomonadales bacterium]|nr:DUF4349 domain-containing protein [Pseudomonadales bacterium]